MKVYTSSSEGDEDDGGTTCFARERSRRKVDVRLDRIRKMALLSLYHHRCS